MKPLLRVFLFLSCLLAPLAPAQADDSSPVVSLQVAPCVEVDAAVLRRFFAVELATSLPTAKLGLGPDATGVEITCEDTSPLLIVHDRITGKRLSRPIRLTRSKRGRERTLALAAVELLIASWVELEVQPSSHRLGPPMPSSSVRSARAVASRHLTRPRWQNGLLAIGSIRKESHGWTLGTGLRWFREQRSGLGGSLEGSFHSAEASVSSGTVAIQRAQLAIGLHLHRQSGLLGFRGGPGLRLGMVRMQGSATDSTQTMAGTFDAFALEVLAQVSVDRSIGPLLMSLSFEPGYYLVGVGALVDDMREVAVRGFAAGFHLGVGARW